MDAFLNALKAVSITFSQHIVKLFHRANRSFISQPLLPTQGPWVDPGKKEDFGNLSSGGRGFQLVFEKGLGETWSRVITSTTFLSIPCTRFAFPQDLSSKGSSGQVCGVTAPGVGAVSVKMMLPGWAHGWCTQQLQKASAGAGGGLCPRSAVSWPRSTSAGNPCSSLNSSQTLVLALELCSHPFCCESCFSIFALLQISTMYGLGTKKSNGYRLKINPSP